MSFKIKGLFPLLFFLPRSFFTSKKLRIKKSEDYLMKINNSNTSSLSALYNTNRLLKNKLALTPDPLYHYDAAFTISDHKVSGMIYVMFVMHSMLMSTGNILKEITDTINARLRTIAGSKNQANRVALMRSREVEAARVVNVHYQLIGQLLASTTALYKKAVHHTIL